MLVLAHLRCGNTYTRLAAGFWVGIATVHRYIREAVDLLAALALTLEQAMTTVRKKAYVILDGTALPIDRIAADRPYYLGKKKAHGMNVQVIADPAGRLIWASDVLPGAVHDLTAARTQGIPAALAADGVKCWADKAYQGAGPAVRVPFRGKNLRAWRRRHNRDHAKIRSLGERAMATLRCWRLLRKLRAAPPGSPPSSVPLSHSNSPPDQDGKGSLSRTKPRPSRRAPAGSPVYAADAASLRQERVSPSPYRAGRAVDAEEATQLHNPLVPGQGGRLEFDRYTWSQESRWMLSQQFSAW